MTTFAPLHRLVINSSGPVKARRLHSPLFYQYTCTTTPKRSERFQVYPNKIRTYDLPIDGSNASSLRDTGESLGAEDINESKVLPSLLLGSKVRCRQVAYFQPRCESLAW